MNTADPMDWVLVLAMFQLFGMKYLLAATDGWHFVNITAKKRKAALAIGMGIIWIPFLLVWTFYGHSPVDMWDAATAWWQADHIGSIGKVIAVAGWWLLLSPLQVPLAVWSIRRATRREQQQQQRSMGY